ncbi:MAG: MFS transporter [Pseudomonadales bacterium]|nr:MFS transporter [Pseudomonadales bacterium]
MLSIRQTLALLRDRRFATIFLLGFSSGFPWVLHGSVLTLWMQQSGLSRSAIGYIGAVTAIYAFNWAWSPLVDKFKIPLLFRLFGRRRSWILLTQGLIVIAVLLLSQADPALSLLPVSLLALAIALASATQDVAVDAYRITLFSKAESDEKMPYSAAVATIGWWSGYGFIGGAFALWLGSASVGLSWPGVYQALALLYGVLMGLICLSPEPDEQNSNLPASYVNDDKRGTGVNWFLENIAAPFAEFFQRCGFKLALSILVFLFSFRLGEAMLGRMSLVFYVELGFSTEEIALYQKFFGGLATAVFSLLGAFINTRYGVIKGMLVGGIAMSSSNLLYALMAQVGPDPGLFVITLLIDNFTQAFATVAVISFMSYFASRTYTGTQFALMSSISNFGRTTLAAGSGVIVDALGGNWSLFFIITTVIVVPSLILLVWLGKQVDVYRGQQEVVSLSADDRS